MRILDRITEELKTQKKTQKNLCDFLGLSSNNYTDWKSGKSSSYKKYLPEIAEYLNVSIDYLLGKTNIKEKMQEYANFRKEKQPLNMPSAGSTFKRGSDFITAKIIDECGLKGFSIGGAEVSNKHAGFVVNKGEATAADVLNLVEYVKKVVYEKTNKNIELEIEVIGE